MDGSSNQQVTCPSSATSQPNQRHVLPPGYALLPPPPSGPQMVHYQLVPGAQPLMTTATFDPQGLGGLSGAMHESALYQQHHHHHQLYTTKVRMLPAASAYVGGGGSASTLEYQHRVLELQQQQSIDQNTEKLGPIEQAVLKQALNKRAKTSSSSSSSSSSEKHYRKKSYGATGSKSTGSSKHQAGIKVPVGLSTTAALTPQHTNMNMSGVMSAGSGGTILVSSTSTSSAPSNNQQQQHYQQLTTIHHHHHIATTAAASTTAPRFHPYTIPTSSAGKRVGGPSIIASPPPNLATPPNQSVTPWAVRNVPAGAYRIVETKIVQDTASEKEVKEMIASSSPVAATTSPPEGAAPSSPAPSNGDSTTSTHPESEPAAPDQPKEEGGHQGSGRRKGGGAQKDVQLPNPLPRYITKIDKPPPRVLKESLHCTTCDIYVNSENQMKQHVNSTRHKNTLEGIPTAPKPGREEKAKPKAEQYRCSVCKVTLNSDIQLSQHLTSQRHNNMLEGRPTKRWHPYERNHGATASAIIPHRAISMAAAKPSSLVILPAPHAGGGGATFTTAAPPAPPTATIQELITSHQHQQQMIQQEQNLAKPGQHMQLVTADQSGMLQARGIVYIPAQQLHHHAATAPAGIQTMPPGTHLISPHHHPQGAHYQLSYPGAPTQTLVHAQPGQGLSLIPQLSLTS